MSLAVELLSSPEKGRKASPVRPAAESSLRNVRREMVVPIMVALYQFLFCFFVMLRARVPPEASRCFVIKSQIREQAQIDGWLRDPSLRKDRSLTRRVPCG